MTIVLTVYKRTAFIAGAIASALAQTYPSFEILVADDSNSEEIRKICESFESPKIHYRPNPVNLGVTLSIKNAIGAARGEFIAVLNDDDLWETGFLENLVPPLVDNPDFVLAFSDHWVIREDGSIDAPLTEKISAQYGRTSLPAGKVEDFPELVVVRNGVPLAMAAVFRKGGFDRERLVPEIQGSYDFWISCLLAASGGAACYVPQRLTRYRLHGNMETARKAPGKNDNLVYIFRNLSEMEAFRQFRPILRKRHGEALYRVASDQLNFGDPIRARCGFRESWSASRNPKALLGLVASYLPKSLIPSAG